MEEVEEMVEREKNKEREMAKEMTIMCCGERWKMLGRGRSLDEKHRG